MNDQTACGLHDDSVAIPGDLQVGSGDDGPACSDQPGTLWIVAGPGRAGSDEITSTQLHRLLAQLAPGGDSGRASGSGGSVVRNAAILIDELREQIDAVDVTLLYALARRMSLVQQIGRHKKAASITTVQVDRWMKLLEHRLALARNLDLSGDFVLALFELIHKEAIHVQDDLLRPAPEGAPQS